MTRSAPRRKLFGMGRVGVLIVGVAMLLLTAAAAAGSASPVSPAAGAVVSGSHPLFSWSVPVGEESEAIYLASKPDTTPDGEFFSENVVDEDVFSSGELSWSPTEALFSGRYWWSVETVDENFASSYSRPIDFTVPAQARFAGLLVERLTGLRLATFKARWVTNIRNPLLVFRVKQGRKIVGSKTLREDTVLAGSPDEDEADWYVPRRVKRGVLLTLTATLKAGTFSATTRRRFRAP